MFSYHPERFFPGTQIDIVFYPQGKDGDPNNFTETEPFRGPVHLTLRRALDYLKYMVVRKNIHKPKDDEHTYFIIRIPCHPEFVCEELSMDKEGHILPVGEVWKPDVTENVTDVSDNVSDNGTDNGTESGTEESTAEKRRGEILRLMKLDKKITYDNLVNILHVSRRTIARDIDLLRSQNKLMREGGDYDGKWIVIE